MFGVNNSMTSETSRTLDQFCRDFGEKTEVERQPVIESYQSVTWRHEAEQMLSEKKMVSTHLLDMGLPQTFNL